jgi:hypothetical protein
MTAAFVVYAESGEYSDHTFRVLAVALTEADARAACERLAKETAASDRWTTKIARPTQQGDYGHADGHWCAIAQSDPDEPARLGAYNGESIGFERADLVTPEGSTP